MKNSHLAAPEVTVSNTFRRFIAILTAFCVLGIAHSADAQRKKKKKKIKPACEITAIPFIVGTEWVYKAVPPPTPPKGPLPKPRQPATIIIKVLAVELQENKETLITLEEKAQDKVYTTKLRCKKDALIAPPESFFFSGEPGGGIQIELGEVTRAENSAWTYQFVRGKLMNPTWIEEIKAPFTRTKYEGTNIKIENGSLDLQRNIIVGWNQPEDIETDLGPMSATPLQVDLRGSVFLDMETGKQEFSIPANTLSKLWFVDEIGLVQVYNTNVHMYQLMNWTDPNADPEAPPEAGAAAAGKPAAKPAAKN